VKQQSEEAASRRKKTYDSYQAYVTAERKYLREPTPENWENKERAFEIFNRALLEQQNSSMH
tara:strand:- start:52 stop:237 length:186 start_codon:yes stop_codon:yes gene_type:complete